MSREVCHCGHHKSTHFEDPSGPGDCLGVACTCKRYCDESRPDTRPHTKKRPHHASWCRCYGCVHGVPA